MEKGTFPGSGCSWMVAGTALLLLLLLVMSLLLMKTGCL